MVDIYKQKRTTKKVTNQLFLLPNGWLNGISNFSGLFNAQISVFFYKKLYDFK